jgi:uncharacterized protein (TIGR03437 family)
MEENIVPMNGNFFQLVLCLTVALLTALQTAYAQQVNIDGKTNLIQNGGAEAGPAGTDLKTAITNIPNWVITGSPTVLSYGLAGYVLLSDPAPPDHGFQYFASTVDRTSTLTQTIDVSSAATTIANGNIKYTVSAYLGSVVNNGDGVPVEVEVDFKNTNGQILSSAAPLGPYAGLNRPGMSLQQQIGLVPAQTAMITVTLTITNVLGAADSLSLVLGPLGTTPVLGTNLVVNGGAEAGPNAPDASTALYVPGWSTSNGTSVCPYGGTGWIQLSDPGPADRGVSLFCTNEDGSTMYQDIDVSPSATLIDSGQVMYQVSAWLGGLGGATGTTVTYLFFDWNSKQLAATAELGPVRAGGRGLFETSHQDVLPPGTRRVRLLVTFPAYFWMADNIEFTLIAPSGPPVINAGGIISASAFGGSPAIAPGTLIEIYGSNLSSKTEGWGSSFMNGVAPVSLDGVTVSVGGTPAFINYVSPGQVNALTASDTPISSGFVDITLMNSSGTSDPLAIYVNATQPGLLAPPTPTYLIAGKQYVAATLPDTTVAGVPSHPAVPGDILTIYGIGFGPVSDNVSAGTIPTQGDQLSTPLQFFFGSTLATLTYSGLAPGLAGLYQFDVVVPDVAPNNAMPISINLGSVIGSQKLYIAVGK